ncbi:hypothetical protein [Roseisolibacter sp. H3M3-2]|uniref:hypothetical protein n=1 Tax=Roseisolibacter sp. H3M3-2 TaxID=3031323 RepID=UPI0023DC934C|nr:hypothetical protein [Roseisolibacter sp. H3M3-2]MDF1503864.1 hypothetical protein [Roseisolibacter sp. H3M3-2]
MPSFHVSRPRALRALHLPSVGVALLGGLLVACGDAPSAPRGGPAPSAAPRQAVWSVGDTTYTTFTYTPAAALEQGFANAHKLSMPAGAVCDPQTSGYGPSLWDAACTPLAQPITFTAKSWTSAAGRPRITFSPDVRFVPGKVVTLRLKDVQASDLGVGALVWCPQSGAACVDEGATDASLATYFSKNEMFVFRRLKHFSGYTVVVDRAGGGEDNGFGF